MHGREKKNPVQLTSHNEGLLAVFLSSSFYQVKLWGWENVLRDVRVRFQKLSGTEAGQNFSKYNENEKDMPFPNSPDRKTITYFIMHQVQTQSQDF